MTYLTAKRSNVFVLKKLKTTAECFKWEIATAEGTSRCFELNEWFLLNGQPFMNIVIKSINK